MLGTIGMIGKGSLEEAGRTLQDCNFCEGAKDVLCCLFPIMFVGAVVSPCQTAPLPLHPHIPFNLGFHLPLRTGPGQNPIRNCLVSRSS